MILVTTNTIGRVHHAEQHPDLQETRPCYCYVPEEYFEENGLSRERFIVSLWPSINCSANPNGIGSHVFPDPEKPVAVKSRCPILREFLDNLETIAAIKTAKPAA